MIAQRETTLQKGPKCQLMLTGKFGDFNITSNSILWFFCSDHQLHFIDRYVYLPT